MTAPETKRRGLPTGIQRKHSRKCPAFADKTARCRAKGCTYQAQAGPRGARQTKTSANLDELKTWKRDVDDAKAAGRLRKTRSPTLRVAADWWERDAKAGVALARGKTPFKAGRIKYLRHRLDHRLLDMEVVLELDGGRRVLGDERLDQVDQQFLNRVVADLMREGLAPSTVRNTIMALRAVWRHAVRMSWTAVNPTVGLEVPSGLGRRERFVPAGEVLKLIRALPVRDRALWATAFYAGLRRSELAALRWEEVDLAKGVIHVRRKFDPSTMTIDEPKSEAGKRKVPIPPVLRELLIEHRARAGARPRGLVFSRGSLAGRHVRGMGDREFYFTNFDERAEKAFHAAALQPVTLHDCRHTFASLIIAAMAQRGVFNPKALQEIMGHASIQETSDRYGYLFPGAAEEVGAMLADYLDVAERPAVTQALSRFVDALGDADAEVALPAVAEALELLSSWQAEHAGACVAGSGERAVIVQRAPRTWEA